MLTPRRRRAGTTASVGTSASAEPTSNQTAAFRAEGVSAARARRTGITSAAPAAHTIAASSQREAPTRQASESSRGAHQILEGALLGVRRTEHLILEGDLSQGAAQAEAACLVFERGSHEIFAMNARLLNARCLARVDTPSADRLTARVEAFARERALFFMQAQALILRGLLALDLTQLDEAAQLAGRIGSPWLLASIANVRGRILERRKDEAASSLERKAFLFHMSILLSEEDQPARTRVIATAEKGLHPFLI